MSTTKKENKSKAKQANPSGVERFLETYQRHKKMFHIGLVLILVGVIGGLSYQYLYMEPRETKAATSMSMAQRYFEQDSLQKSLEGDGQQLGFLRIMSKFSGTDAANLSQYYAGIAYLKMEDFDKAIRHLEKFDGGSTYVQLAAWGALGDAYMEKGNIDKGIRFYMKAASDKANVFYTPLYLYRAGIAYEMADKPQEAIKAFRRIRDEYPQSTQAQEMDRLLAKLGVVN